MTSSKVRVKFWGTRGSIATPGSKTVRYGGNTSCVEVRHEDSILLLDCGTGARESGLALSKEFQDRALTVNLFVSHTHWDHIQGFPFFLPAYSAGNSLRIYSVRGTDKSLKRIFTGQMDASYFPVSLGDMTASLEFNELEGPVTIGDAVISYIYVNHPGIAIGFRIDVDGRSIVYVTDHEPYSRLYGSSQQNRERDCEIDAFAKGATLYIREAQYTEEEYASKRGWGHGTFSDALQSAHESGVATLAIFHHDPMHDDAMLDHIQDLCRVQMKQRGMGYSLMIASDNLEVTV